jgi:glutathione S-transferase
MGPTDDALITAKMAEVERFLPILERGLNGRDWLAEKLSLADFAVASTFPLREPALISLAKTPNVNAWIQRVEELPSWQQALPRSLNV